MNRIVYEWERLLDIANKELEEHNAEIIVKADSDETYFSVIIRNGDVNIVFAENMFGDELAECINDAWANARIAIRNSILREAMKDETLSFRKVHGGTHDDPALIASLTEFPVYFHDTDTDDLLNIDNYEAGIDAFQDRNGDFYVREQDYEQAYMDVEAHDNGEEF